MRALNLCFKIHLPKALNNYDAGSIGKADSYFNPRADQMLVDQLAELCYLPANEIVASMIAKHKGRFKLSYSISGTALEILCSYRPDVIESFRELAATGCIEFLGETYYNSLCWLYSKKEFARQLQMHAELVKDLFDMETTVLRNTELIYCNEMASVAHGLGFKAIWCEGIGKFLNGRSPNHVFRAPGETPLALLPRNAGLSDDIAFRFDQQDWEEHPLTAEKYAGWIHAHTRAETIHLLMDYETFGLYKTRNTGIFDFLENLAPAILQNEDWRFALPSEIIASFEPTAVYDVPTTISWGDKEIECCVWCENSMQNNMLRKIYSLEKMVHKTRNEQMLEEWGQLQSADHFYFMSNKGRTMHDAYLHRNPFSSAESAHKNYVNIITDFEIRLIEHGLHAFKETEQHLHYGTLY